MAGLVDRGSFAYDDGEGNTGFIKLIYDEDFDITWVADGNFAQATGYDGDGRMDWVAANAWAGGLTIGGFADWRLPTALNQDDSGPGYGYVTGSEMGHLFYEELGGTAGDPISSSTDSDLALFPNLQNSVYWSGTEYSANPNLAWVFSFDLGSQFTDAKGNDLHYGLAVHSGDVGAVPVPAAVWLFGSGILGLIGFSKRKKAAA
ncbi:MAG: DUF1566 domain-containing protein [Gammaproteobacteria bacterium]|nr:DUF1566 domain-containing protein [Gammaproteobacteria bacterium]